jgi:nitrite reductase/ring-hydroxylating ferredoxin subunit
MHPTPPEYETGIAVGDLDPARPRPVDTPWGTMALFDLGGEIACVQAFCPHLEGPLFQGTVAAGQVTCPWHFWRFDLRTGARTDWLHTPMGGGARCGGQDRAGETRVTCARTAHSM